MLVVDADIEMWTAADLTWERPRIPLDSAADASEVESVTMFYKLECAARIDGNVGHQGASDRALRVSIRVLAIAEDAGADATAGAVGAYEDRGLEDAAVGDGANSRGVLLNVQHAASLDDFEATLACGAGQARVELIATNDSAEHVAAGEIDVADRGARMAANHFDRGDLEREPELLEREHGLGYEPAGADFETRMRKLLQRRDAQSRTLAQQVQRGRQPGWTGARNEHVVCSWRVHRIGRS